MFRIRVFCLLLCVILLSGLMFPVSAAMTPRLPAQQDRQVISVHSSPAQGATVIGRLENGTELTAPEDAGLWYRIDCGGLTGYVRKDQVICDGETYTVSCEPRTEHSPVLPGRVGSLTAVVEELLETAVSFLGVPYVFGGTSPQGFDCSGFVQYCYASLGYTLNRGATGQLSDGLVVMPQDLKPGDLVFFTGTSQEIAIATHVGIYLGEGKFIHAGSQGISIAELGSSYFSAHFIGARRIIISGMAEYESAPFRPMSRRQTADLSSSLPRFIPE